MKSLNLIKDNEYCPFRAPSKGDSSNTFYLEFSNFFEESIKKKKYTSEVLDKYEILKKYTTNLDKNINNIGYNLPLMPVFKDFGLTIIKYLI